MKQRIIAIVFLIFIASCNTGNTIAPAADVVRDTIVADTVLKDTIKTMPAVSDTIKTKNVSPEDVVAFAKTLTGVPYKYASTDPAQGFDCSGFITYVFNHFNIAVPRSSIDFTNMGTAVDKTQAKTGDLILFTGTDTLETNVGHMGIVTENIDSLRFIHSTSGKKYGVTITALNGYYEKRFVKVIRVF